VKIIVSIFVIIFGLATFAQDLKPNKAKAAQDRMRAALATAVKPKVARALSTLDPNAALEVRGQARTLSMMLVLKNSKESINFIKVRKDYKPEIGITEF